MAEEPATFDASKLHVTFAGSARPGGPLTPRRYTLTHSDRTGDLYLTIGSDYDRRALRALQVRLMRDEVLGEWVVADRGPRLELRMMAQGGIPLFGTGAVRRGIFARYRPLVLAALRRGDGGLAAAHPEMDDAPVLAHFTWRDGRVDAEPWGAWGDWR
jgi:hypothetical protein